MPTPTRINAADGKYTLVMEPTNMRALRYGEAWRDLIGDGFVMALGHEIEALGGLLKESALTFRTYEAHHRAKTSEAGRPEKAARNAELAEEIERMLTEVFGHDFLIEHVDGHGPLTLAQRGSLQAEFAQ